jgi:hypothetical protein
VAGVTTIGAASSRKLTASRTEGRLIKSNKNPIVSLGVSNFSFVTFKIAIYFSNCLDFCGVKLLENALPTLQEAESTIQSLFTPCLDSYECIIHLKPLQEAI